MFNFLRKGLRLQKKADKKKRSAHEALVRQETDYQLRINELNRKVEKQQQRLKEILEKGRRETSELSRLSLAEQYARTERQVHRLLDRRKMLVKAQELVEVQIANIDLQDVIPQEILELHRPENQRERAMNDVLRDRLDQAYDDMLAGFEHNVHDSQSDSYEKATIQAVLDLFERKQDEEIRLTLHAIEEDLNAVVEGVPARNNGYLKELNS